MTAFKETPKLPNQDHTEFAALIKMLADKYKPLYIYRFGKLMESNFNTGCFIADSAAENYRYYLLMVIDSDARIEHAVQDYATSHLEHGTITILVHGKQAMIEAIKANNKFFITVANHGELLYSHDPTVRSFQVPEYIPTRAAEKAKKHHQRHLSRATGFIDSAMECLRTEKCHLCLFMLHQVVEQCCLGMIRIHLGYKSDIHNLYRLLRLCDSFSPAMSGMFLDEGEEGRRLFDLIANSYSAARYQDVFEVSQQDANKLLTQVESFLTMANILCIDKIEALTVEAANYKQFKLGGMICDN